MPGFYITNIKPTEIKNEVSTPHIKECMQVDNFYICRNTREQFLDDKIFFQDENLVIIIEGVIFNKHLLIKKYGSTDFISSVKQMISKNPKDFYSEFRGMFSGAVYNKSKQEWIVFVDQICNRPVYYYFDQKNLIISSQINHISETMALNNILRMPDEESLKIFLAYGCYMDERTCLLNLNRILPGDYICVKNNQLSVCTYHTFNETENNNLTDEEAIKILDSAFNNAIDMAAQKNKEYGYNNLLDISGGADSRIIAYALAESGHKNIVGCHYSQSNSNEMQISKKICKKLSINCAFNSLDDAGFLKDIDKLVNMNSGASYYCGITGGERILSSMLDKNAGIEFTGLLGNVFDGGMLLKNGDIAPTIKNDCFVISSVIDRSNFKINTISRFKTNDMFWLYERGMLCGMSPFQIRQNYVEPFTPFGNVEFINAWLSIPWKQKVENKILLKWLKKRFPSATKIKYAATGLPLYVYINKFFTNKVIRKFLSAYIKLTLLLKIQQNNMNPFQKWENEIPWLKKWLNEYYLDALNCAKANPNISGDFISIITKVYNSNNSVMEKYVSLTVLSIIKQFIS